MSFPISAGLLDSMVLSIVSREDTYGYEITQTMRKAVDVSESTLYPVLKRLQKSQMLETYDKEYMGRNRRYYHVTTKGAAQLNDYRNEWVEHKNKVDSILLNEQKTANEKDNNDDNKILKEEELLPQEA
ncbi:MAG: PadR family transcriptional regulator [Ruminococcus sp.]|nr:PadR family transcriptional regulator [Ruminococcus sp.]